MADEDKEEKKEVDGEEDESASKKGGKKLLIIIAAVVLLLVGGVAAAYFLRRSLGSRWLGKRYSIFLSHQKASTGIFARDLSLSMADYCPKKIFLDADFLVMLPTLLSTLSTEVDCMVVLRAVHSTQGAEAGRRRQPKLWRARSLLYRRRSLQVNSKYM